MPSNATAPLFAAARRFGIGFHLGYAEIAEEPDESGTYAGGGSIRRSW